MSGKLELYIGRYNKVSWPRGHGGQYCSWPQPGQHPSAWPVSAELTTPTKFEWRLVSLGCFYIYVNSASIG